MKILRNTVFAIISATTSLLALSADLPETSTFTGHMLSAINDLAVAYSDLTTVQQIVKEIESGKPVSATQGEWKDLSSKYAAAASKINLLPLPTDFDKKIYSVSMAELSVCRTRSASLFKLNGLADTLRKAIASEEALLGKIDQSLMEASGAAKALTYLAEMNLKLAGLPIYGQTFLWNWFDLQNNVSKSLSITTDALKSKRKKILENLGLSKTQLANLTSNLTLLATAKCELAGAWRGTCKISGKASDTAFQFTKTGTGFICRKLSPNTPVNCGSISFNESTNQISFDYLIKWNGDASSQTISYRGAVSDDYKSMNLTVRNIPIKNADAPWSGTCRLTP